VREMPLLSGRGKRQSILKGKSTMGLRIIRSNVNQAWFLMWFDQVLGIYIEEWEAQAALDDLLLNDNSGYPAHQKGNK